MATEIERKFLLVSDDWRRLSNRSERLVQGYLSRADNGSVRVRIRGERAELNIKSTRDGIHRLEYEYQIPLDDARQLLAEVALKPLIEKTRYWVEYEGATWEIDVFHGDNDGLVLAELELTDADQPFSRPPWIGREVSTDRRYYNTYLSEHPFQSWSASC